MLRVTVWAGAKSMKDSTIIIFFVFSFILLNVLFFPKMYAAIDEYGYLKNSFLLKEGSIVVKDPEYACSANPTNDGFMISRFIGKSVFLIPFTFLGLYGIMLSGLIIHLINFLLIFLILKRLKYASVASLLYLFVPVLAWESRTLNAELLVLTFLLGAFYFYIKETKWNWFFSGLLFGFAAFTRYDAALAFGAFFLANLLQRKLFRLKYLCLGFIPILMLLLFFNNVIYGGFLDTGYGSQNSGLWFILSVFLETRPITFVISAILLLVMYPLMLISPYYKKFPYKLEFFLLSLTYLFLNAKFTDYSTFDFSIPSYLTFRLRYLVPLIGMLIIPYSLFYTDLVNFLNKKIPLRAISKQAIIFGSLLLLLTGNIALSYAHSKFIDSRYAVLNQIQQNIPEGSLTIGSSDDCMYFLKELYGNKKYLKVDLLEFYPKYSEKDIYSFIDKELSLGSNVFVLDLYYSNVADSNALRKLTVVDKERAKIKEFIKANENNFQLIYETESPHFLKIYKFIK